MIDLPSPTGVGEGLGVRVGRGKTAVMTRIPYPDFV
jgi:hypothetical protein